MRRRDGDETVDIPGAARILGGVDLGEDHHAGDHHDDGDHREDQPYEVLQCDAEPTDDKLGDHDDGEPGEDGKSEECIEGKRADDRVDHEPSQSADDRHDRRRDRVALAAEGQPTDHDRRHLQAGTVGGEQPVTQRADAVPMTIPMRDCSRLMSRKSTTIMPT